MSLSQERNELQTAKRDDNPAHALRKNMASDDFFTDSLLESSRIPTPSPSKKQAKSAFPSKPRRAIGNTRTLRAAWDATASSGRRSSAGSDLLSMQENLKPAPIQATRRSPPSPAKSRSAASPPRGRQSSLPVTSPTSDASSPPRGLNDVYQRIADEERLAAQEGEIEEDESTDSSMAYNESGDDDRARLDRIRSSQSPLNLRSSSRNTPQPQAADANKENQREDTGLTDASGMSFLENMTDQILAAKLTPHTQDRARDRARLDKAIQKTTPLAFSKAQVGSRHALTSENLHLSGSRRNPESMHSSSNGSTLNEDIAPPPNVPRTWGTKGRVDKDWLRKIHDRNGSPANGSPKGDNQRSSQIDWTAAAADVPLPSVEDSLTPRPEQSRNSTPASLSKQTSLDRIRQWELNDFTGTNLHVSNSPPVKVRTSVPDQYRDREIETLEKRAVTTNRLGEIKKNSNGLFAGRSRTSSAKVRNGAEDETFPDKHQAIIKIEEEGEPIPDTPIVVYKASANGIKKDKDARSRPLHDRKDSRDSLQRLARAISESPRPSSTPEDWSLIKEEEAEEIRKPKKMQDESRKSSKEIAEASPTSSVKRSRSADAARTPIVTGAWTDTILPDTVKTVKQRHTPLKYAQTPHVTGGWVDTPVATGKRQSSALAPIPMEELPEKPASELPKEESEASRKGDRDVKPVLNRAPNLPRSALTSLLTKAKRKLATTTKQPIPLDEEDHDDVNNPSSANDTLNLGDATIESLEDLLTLDNADMTTLLRMGAEYDARDDPRQDQDKDKDKEAGSGTETELLERLGTKLERLRTNIHDARKGISKLEYQVSQPRSATSLIKPNDAHIGGVAPCQSCGCPRGTTISSASSHPKSPSRRLYLTLPPHIPEFQIPIPALWHPGPQHSGRRGYLPRPTPLGYLICAVWLWYLAESLLCLRYCKPEFAEYYTWSEDWGGREAYLGEMKWGWLVWTFVRRWWERGWMGWVGMAGRAWWVLLKGMVRWVGVVVGWMVGFLGEVGGATSGSGSGSGTIGLGGDGANGMGRGGGGLGSDPGVLGMGQDEYL